MSKVKRIFSKLAILVMVLSLFTGTSIASAATTAKAPVQKAQIQIYKDGKLWYKKTVTLKKGDTIMSATKRYYKVVDKNGFVDSINKVKSNNKTGKYWFLKVNGKSATKGANQIKIKAKDKIVWSYEKWKG
jgi:hypothetical protein